MNFPTFPQPQLTLFFLLPFSEIWTKSIMLLVRKIHNIDANAGFCMDNKLKGLYKRVFKCIKKRRFTCHNLLIISVFVRLVIIACTWHCLKFSARRTRCLLKPTMMQVFPKYLFPNSFYFHCLNQMSSWCLSSYCCSLRIMTIYLLKELMRFKPYKSEGRISQHNSSGILIISFSYAIVYLEFDHDVLSDLWDILFNKISELNPTS